MMKRIHLYLFIFALLIMTGCGTDSQDSAISVSSEAASESTADTLSDSIQAILDNKEYYPDITSIEVTPDYTEFTITLESDIMNTYESMLVMSFYTAGNEHQIASGIAASDARTTVRYINGSTNEVISETDSSTMITE